MTRRGVLAAAGSLTVASPNGLLRAVHLRCEYLTDPLGIDVARPRLSWRCVAGPRQAAYRIRAGSAPGAADLWDSDVVPASTSLQIPYGGGALVSRQQIFWSVRLHDDSGRPGPWSPAARWTMGLLAPADWQARWIGLDTPPPHRTLDATWFWHDESRPLGQTLPGPRFFRRVFTLARPACAGDLIAFACADPAATFTVDGIPIGDAYGWADAATLRVPALAAGRHVLTAQTIIPETNVKPRGIALRFEDHFNTEAGWVSRDRAESGWQSPAFDDSTWRPAIAWGATGVPPWGPIAVHPPDPVPARTLRRAFHLAAAPRTASVSFCGLGWSEFHINGTPVSDARLSPPLTDYDRRLIYVTYDVAGLLRPGANVLGAILGPGRFIAPRASARTYGWPKLLLRLDATLADGSHTVITSDRSWQLTLAGPIRDSNEYDGEIIDQRLAMPGWSAPGFDASAWHPAGEVDAPGGGLTAMRQHPTRIVEARDPIHVTHTAPATWTFDFGQNLAGICRLRTRGPRGAQITLRHAERLHADGTLDTLNLRSAAARDIITLGGTGVETITPSFTTHGFRYATAAGLPQSPGPGTLTALVVSDDLPRTGHFTCSDPRLNRLHDAALWSARNNTRSIRTDCPQRDERLGWLGDPAEEARGEAYLFDNAALYAKILRDIIDAQRPDGALPDIAPALLPLYKDDVSWPAMLAIIPATLHDHYADRAIVAEIYPALVRWLDRMWNAAPDHAGRDQYGDWGEMAKLWLPTPLIGTAYLAHCYERAGAYAALLGHTADAASHTARAAAVRATFQQKFHRLPDNLYGDAGATACILTLAFNLADPSHVPAVRRRLISLILADGGPHACFGLIGAQWVNRVLSDAGRGDLAHRMAVASIRPSLGYMIDHGATTLWELWDSDAPTSRMSSLDHTMLTGDLLVWLYQHVTGIGAAAPGFARALIAPRPIPTLAWARASYDAMPGRIESGWRREAGRIVYDITLPPNVEGTLSLPTETAAALQPGRHRFVR